MTRRLVVISLLSFLFATAGCQLTGKNNNCTTDEKLSFDFKSPPRIRLGFCPSSTLILNFARPDALGVHSYASRGTEKNGMLYTCKAGHIDTAHVRLCADWTAHLAAKVLKNLKKNDTGFSFKLNVEPSKYFVKLTYPQNWGTLSKEEKQRISRDVSIKLGKYLSYTAGTWHEILTWFGYKFVGVYPEFHSAFSWEDSFSNLLGTNLAVQALEDSRHNYDQAMTLAFNRELENLDVCSRFIAKHATRKVKGSWFSGDLIFVTMNKRNFDIGLDDGYVTPVTVPQFSWCQDFEPQKYPVPNTDFLADYGFKMEIQIQPKEWEKAKIMAVIYPDKKNGKTT